MEMSNSTATPEATATPITPTPTVTPPQVNPYQAVVRSLIDRFRALRDEIPRLVFPPSKPIARKLISNASVPDAAVEMASVTIVNTPQLAVGSGANADDLNDQRLYATAVNPLADELEAIAGATRFSVTDARHKAGSDALNVYALAKRLAARPGYEHLIPVVANMQRLLGRKQPRPRKKAASGPATTPTTTPVKTS
jgi:hypothetical protein